jgi:hypothetical protein
MSHGEVLVTLLVETSKGVEENSNWESFDLGKRCESNQFLLTQKSTI